MHAFAKSMHLSVQKVVGSETDRDSAVVRHAEAADRVLRVRPVKRTLDGFRT